MCVVKHPVSSNGTMNKRLLTLFLNNLISSFSFLNRRILSHSVPSSIRISNMPDPELLTLEDALKEEKFHWQSQQPFMNFFYSSSSKFSKFGDFGHMTMPKTDSKLAAFLEITKSRN